MSEVATRQRPVDIPVVIWALLSILSISLFLQYEISLKQALLFLLGSGLGFILMQALFGFSGSWRRMIRERRSLGIRAQISLLIFTSLLFFPLLGGLVAKLHPGAAIGPVGISVLAGAFLFGIGMQLGGGCGSGTLYTVGQGQVDMLLTLAFFIVGATLGSAHLGWWLGLPSMGKLSLIEQWGWLPALLVQLSALAGLYWLVVRLEQKRHAACERLFVNNQDQRSWSERFILGPWPLWWGIVGLAVMGLLTLLLAGYPWSITFAFGLWGTKLWTALGGDISSWTYWQSGYAATALNQSVLQDVTSVMDFGLIIGAMLAAALVGKYAPPMKLHKNRVVAAIIGGLLLGYGARLAFGCNIGAMLGGIGSGSLHGWLWLVAAFTGGIVGVRLRLIMKLDKPVEAH